LVKGSLAWAKVERTNSNKAEERAAAGFNMVEMNFLLVLSTKIDKSFVLSIEIPNFLHSFSTFIKPFQYEKQKHCPCPPGG
jgi:hypothetical protein